ncbi:mitochondrial metal transporter [Microbotryomycetes sp. JL221]|nr:mitochondrial metal transporter [Microbotryomycetes sp. JL221]
MSSSSTSLKRRKGAGSSATDTTATRSHSSHSHSHSHSHGGHSHGPDEAAQLMSALTSKGSDPGSRITIIGLLSNVGLTVTKGIAGWAMGSAALLADAAHSGSDLMADVVTLTTYNMSRKPVSLTHPYGYGKYESLGSAVVSFLLLGTALGIGLHSYHLLLTTLATMPGMNPEFLASLDLFPHSFGHHDDHHHHDHHGIEGTGSELVDPRAMWFAAGSIVVKEWLYRATLKVAKEQHSNVLLANAFHHRSDAFGSLVAVGAIGGAWLGFPVLDPLGGLLVSGMILKQGAEVGITALKELTDQVTDPTIAPRVHSLLASLRDSSLPPLEPYLQDSSSSISTPSASPKKQTQALPETSVNGNDEQRTPSPTPPSAHTRSHSRAQTPKRQEVSDTLTKTSLPILSIPSIRIFASGPSLLIDIQLCLPASLTLKQLDYIQDVVEEECRILFGKQRVREVVVRFVAQDDD